MQEALKTDCTTEELRNIAFEYNWDDGFEIPRAIADHPNCDLSVALELFWLANADEVYLRTTLKKPHNTEWYNFSEMISKRITEGLYVKSKIPFKVPLTKVQVHKFRKQGLPDVFLTDFEPQPA